MNKRQQRELEEKYAPPYWMQAAIRATVILGSLMFFPHFVGGLVGIVIVLGIAFLVLREAWH